MLDFDFLQLEIIYLLAVFRFLKETRLLTLYSLDALGTVVSTLALFNAFV